MRLNTFNESHPLARSRRSEILGFRADLVSLAVVTVVIAIIVSSIYPDGRRIGQDATVYYLPMFHYLGERLSSWEIPIWNPYQYGGSPFAADPESGWMYYPAMLFYSLFSISLATTLFLISHYCLASFGTFAFARVIGLDPVGATVSAIAIISSVWYYRLSISAPAYVQFTAWLPISLLFLELSLRRMQLIQRSLLVGFASLAYGQIVSAWLGKGAVYAGIALCLYLAYRTLIAPNFNGISIRTRMLNFFGIGGQLAVWTLGFQAASILPRLEYHRVSNLADGYQDSVANTGGWSWAEVPVKLTGMGNEAPGNIILLLGIAGLILAGKRFRALFFGILLVVVLALATREANPLASLVDELPMVSTIHNHFPQHIVMLAFLPLSLLAGITITILVRDRKPGRWSYAVVFLPFFLLWIFGTNLDHIDRTDRFLTAGAACAVSAVLFFSPPTWIRLAVVAGIIFAHMGIFLSNVETIGTRQSGPVMEGDLSSYYDASGAVEFIRQRQMELGGPVRFFGYDPQVGQHVTGFFVPYRRQFNLPGTAALEVNNRATVNGIYDIQGQNNPIQVKLYQDLFTTLNGQAQDYHEASVFESGLDSPYLDLLGVRYIIIPAMFSSDRTDLNKLTQEYPAVYKDESVMVLERPTAKPRAWVVSKTGNVPDNGDALSAVVKANNTSAEISIVGGESLTLASSPDASLVRSTKYRPESMEYEVFSSVDGYLVTSEVVYPGWKAYIDGSEVPIKTAYGAFRSVKISPGDYVVEFRLESKTLQVGLWISVAFHLLLLLFAAVVVRLARIEQSSRSIAPNDTSSHQT